jgi:HSP20 family protein
MANLHNLAAPSAAPCIKMDVEESATHYLVQAELPGLGKGDIDVEVDGNVVSINAELRHPRAKPDEKALRTERFFGARRRTFALPHAIDAASTTARYADGVLSLALPKQAERARRSIAVN